MPGLTKEDLTRHITDVVVPLIKETVGPSVSDIVQEYLAKSAGAPDHVSDQSHAPVVNPTEKMDKGLPFGKAIRALAAAKQNGGGADMALDIMKQWGDGDLSEYMKAHREKAMAAGEAIAGGFLVPDQFSQDVIDLLRPMSVVRGLGPVSMPMPTGTMRVPKITSGSTGYYIGENSTITKSQVATGQLTLTWKKLAALVPISNDLLRFSSPGADAIVRDDMVRSIAQRENAAFLRGDGTSASPKGLRYWATAANIIAANSTVNLANVTVDLGKLILQLKNNNIPMTRPAWIMSPRSEHYLATVQNGNGFFVFRDEVLSGRLWGFPLAVTTEVPVNLTDGGGTNESEIYLVDMADAVIGEAKSLSVDSSGEASYTDGGSLVSSYSQDQTVIRAIAEHDFAMRREESVTLLNQCTWGG
jgi:HK97 family phage major capsid protein